MRKEDFLIETFFNQCCDLYGDEGWAASAWASKENQELMFKCLTLVGDLSTGSILDVGCGQGDLYDYLQPEDYTGIDISLQMIGRAIQKHPDVDFQRKNLLEYEYMHDWVIVGGSFNLRIPETDQMTYLQKLVERAYSLAEKGLVFSVLSENTTPSENQWPQLFYYKPVEIFNMCLSLSKHVSIDHVTLPSQVMIYMPKIS